MAASGAASLVVKMFLLILTFIAICIGSWGIFTSRFYLDYQYERNVSTPKEFVMEFAFVGLSITSFLVCLGSTVLHCVGSKGSTGITAANVGLCASAGILLLIAGALLIAAAEGYCSNKEYPDPRSLNPPTPPPTLPPGGGGGGRWPTPPVLPPGGGGGWPVLPPGNGPWPTWPGGGGWPRRSGRGRSSWSTGKCISRSDGSLEEWRECMQEQCRKEAMYPLLVVSGSLAILVSLGYVVPIGLALMAKKDPPNSAKEMGVQQTGAYGGDGGVYGGSPEYPPIYAAPPPPQYEISQVVSYGIQSPDGSVTPQMSPSQNPPVIYYQYGPAQGGWMPQQQYAAPQ